MDERVIPLQTVLSHQYNAFDLDELRRRNHRAMAGCNLSLPSYQRGDPAIVGWLEKNAWIECSLYDHNIPPHAVTPLHLYDGDMPWVALTLCFDPYNATKSVFTDPDAVAICFREKQEQYLIKSFRFADMEIGWLCYNFVDGVYLLHHNQVRGSYRDRLTQNELLWVHRFLLRSFCTMIPHGATVITPDSSTLTNYTNTRPDLVPIPTLPFSRHVVGKSGFKRFSAVDMQEKYPALHKRLCFSSLPEQQAYWIYQK